MSRLPIPSAKSLKTNAAIKCNYLGICAIGLDLFVSITIAGKVNGLNWFLELGGPLLK